MNKNFDDEFEVLRKIETSNFKSQKSVSNSIRI